MKFYGLKYFVVISWGYCNWGYYKCRDNNVVMNDFLYVFEVCCWVNGIRRNKFDCLVVDYYLRYNVYYYNKLYSKDLDFVFLYGEKFVINVCFNDFDVLVESCKCY